MAACQRFKVVDREQIVNLLRHEQRDLINPRNKDIDKSRSHLNYDLAPIRAEGKYEYYKSRLKLVKNINDKRVAGLVSWIVTLPKDTPASYEEEFFQSVYEFLTERYAGYENVISAEVHKDESGQPHIHYTFMPLLYAKKNATHERIKKLIQDNSEFTDEQIAEIVEVHPRTVKRKRQELKEGEKIYKLSASAYVDKLDLYKFHKDLQTFLRERKIPGTVDSGVTKKQGGNKTVAELKAERDREAINNETYTRTNEITY